MAHQKFHNEIYIVNSGEHLLLSFLYHHYPNANKSSLFWDVDLNNIVISDLIEHKEAPIRINTEFQSNLLSNDDGFEIPF